MIEALEIDHFKKCNTKVSQKSFTMNNSANNKRRCTLSDNLTFRHRHRRYSKDFDNLHWDQIKSFKLKQQTEPSPLRNEGMENNIMSSIPCQPKDSNSLTPQPSMKNVKIVILSITLLMSIMANPSVAYNVDVNSKVVHSAPRSGCYNDCMFGFSVAEHIEKGQSW